MLIIPHAHHIHSGHWEEQTRMSMKKHGLLYPYSVKKYLFSSHIIIAQNKNNTGNISHIVIGLHTN